MVKWKMLDKNDCKGIIKSLGLVFGDIGTSPIYTLTVIFLLTPPTISHVIGILSLIVWTLIIVVMIEYTWLAMSLGQKGEGGTIVLWQILIPLLKSGRKISFITLLAYVGVSLLFGDGVITPAISILSAVEGITLIPGFEGTGKNTLVLIAGIIAILLFSFQKKGTEKVSWTFGPIMAIWFIILFFSGLINIIDFPDVLLAFNPYYGIKYLIDNGFTGFILLSQVILCATGGEALYADMGHLGKLPIVRAWYFVFFALIMNYLGQGAYIIQNPDAHNVLFEMIFTQMQIFYVPFLIISILATVIASQAMISGMFSIVYQGITTHILPMLRIDYTSSELMSQIYIDFVNWFLLFSVLLVMLIFKQSYLLAEAYGLAVTGTMTLTAIMMTLIFYIKKDRLKTCLSVLVLGVDLVFLFSSFHKIPLGGYWSIILALFPFGIITIFTEGQKKLYKALKPIDLDVFLEEYNLLYNNVCKIKGTALFFARDVRKIPPYIASTMFKNNILYEENVIVSLIMTENPFGVSGSFKGQLGEGLKVFEIYMGYMEYVDVEAILKESGIEGKIIFYGLEDIASDNLIWRLYSVIKRNVPAFVLFYKLPSHKLHGVLSRIEM